eukprot:5266235-Amphidinium_carterae.2
MSDLVLRSKQVLILQRAFDCFFASRCPAAGHGSDRLSVWQVVCLTGRWALRGLNDTVAWSFILEHAFAKTPKCTMKHGFLAEVLRNYAL